MKKAQIKLHKAATAADSVAVMIPNETPAKMIIIVMSPPNADKKAFQAFFRLN